MRDHGETRTCDLHAEMAECVLVQKTDLEWIKRMTWWIFCGMCATVISLMGWGVGIFWNYHTLSATVCVNTEKIIRIEADSKEKDRMQDTRFERHRNMLDDHEKRIGTLEGVRK